MFEHTKGVSMVDRGIPRQIVQVTLTLSSGRNIHGEIQIDLDMRLSDFMNNSDRFVIITDSDNAINIVNKDHIVEIRVQ